MYTLQLEEKYKVTHFLVLFILERFDRLEHHTKGIVLQTIAISTKLGWNLKDRTKDDVMQLLLQLLRDSNDKKKLGLSLLIALLSEFQSTKASIVGLSLDFHSSCQLSFQKQYLILMFQLCLETMHRPDCVSLSIRACELILSWDFTTNPFQKESDVRRPLRLPPEWGVVLQEPKVIQLFFQLAQQYGSDPSLATRLYNCLVQLAGVSGPVFQLPQLKEQYFLNYIHCFDGYIQQIQLDSNEVDLGDKVFGIASVGKYLVKLPFSILAKAPVSVFQKMAQLTLLCITHKAEDIEDGWFLDAGDELLSMWSLFVSELLQYTQDELAQMNAQSLLHLISQVCSEIVGAFINAKVIVPPSESDDEFDEMEKDVDIYEEQLINIASLARFQPLTIQTLLSVLDEKHHTLLQFIQSGQDTSMVMVLQEQIHWGILIAGHILADSGLGETPEIPGSLQKLSQQSEQDLVVLLPTKLFGILDSLSFPIQSPQHTLCSPLLMETIFWFLDRWSCTYLLLDPTNKWSSSNIQQAFGVNGNGGQILSFLLQKVYDHARIWNSESSIIEQIIVLLQGLSKNRYCRDIMISHPVYNEMTTFFLRNIPSFPDFFHSTIVETIAFVSTHCTDEQIRVGYFRMLQETMDGSLSNILNDPHFQQVCKMTSTRESIIVVLEMFCGLVRTVDEHTTVIVFESVAKHFETFIKLLDLYHSYSDLVLYILLIFRDLVKNVYDDALQPQHRVLLYQTIYNLIQLYTKHEIGRHRRSDQEEEIFEDISVLLDLMSLLITAAYEGYERETVQKKMQEKTQIDVAQVVFVGVHSLLPLITHDMLQVFKTH